MSSPQTILVTGSSSGFGALIASTLVEQGHTVLATMRDVAGKNAEAAAALQRDAQGKPGALHVLELDVTSDASVSHAMQQAVSIAGRIDVVINNAGVGYGMGTYAEAVTTDQFQHSFDVNVFGIHRVTRAVLPVMREQGSGLLIMISSTMGRIVLPFSATYTATKYALEGLSESYRYELAPVGVDVAVVEPGGFATTFWTNTHDAADQDRLASYHDLVDLPANMYGSLGEMLQSESAPNPQLVADAVSTLIDTPVGQRPLRVVVDPLTGGAAANAVNRSSTDIQAQLLEGLSLDSLLAVKG